MTWNKDELVNVFGVAAGNPTLSAAKSDRLFIRGLDQISEYRGRGEGRQITASAALKAYGFDVLRAVSDDGSALLCASRSAAGDALRQRRESLGLEQRHVANLADVALDQISAAEESRRLPIRIYERIARVLGIDERYVSVRKEPEGNDQIALRLRTVGQTQVMMTPSVVAALSEAAWVARTQILLEAHLGLLKPIPSEYRSPNFGSSRFPAYRWGYVLAQQVRDGLGLGIAPIPSLRVLVEETLGIPLIQAELGSRVAGATIEVANHRAIVVNIVGRNRHAYIRRATIAHELGHLLCDPVRDLNTLRVDSYAELESRIEGIPDPVEQRANAFSVEFLAPQAGALRILESDVDDRLGQVMHTFGISFTAARYQLWNGADRSFPLESLSTDQTRPEDHWEAAERYTIDYHPVHNIRPSRAGRFSAVVVLAKQRGIISADTAGEYLEATEADLLRAEDLLPGLFQEVFASG